MLTENFVKLLLKRLLPRIIHDGFHSCGSPVSFDTCKARIEKMNKIEILSIDVFILTRQSVHKKGVARKNGRNTSCNIFPDKKSLPEKESILWGGGNPNAGIFNQLMGRVKK